MKTGPLFPLIYNCPKKFIVLQGGTGAGKTVTALQYLGAKAVEQHNLVISIIGQDVPNLKKGAIRDFETFVESDPEIKPHILSYNKTDRVYTFDTGSIIEFNSYDDAQDAKSGKRDYLFVNEANGVPWLVFWEQQRRTRQKVLIDFNPNAAFWCHENLLGDKNREFAGRVQRYITDHRHNPFLSQEEHDSIENIADPDLFQVYARGKTGKVKGLIFGHFKRVKSLPEKADRIIWGIDYGYTNDPTALVKIAVVGRQRYCQELSYAPGISAATLKDILITAGHQDGQIIYSEADPNIINQLRQLRMPVYPAIKGPGSLAASISKVKEFECFYTEDSTNFEKEINTWKWVTAEDVVTGKEIMTNIPMDGWDHCCAATRYAIYTDCFRYRQAN